MGTKEHYLVNVENFLEATHSGDSLEEELFFARKIAEFNGAKASLLSAKAVADFAIRHSSELGSETSILLGESICLAQKAHSLDLTGITKGESIRFMGTIPSKLQLIEGRLPDLKRVQTDYEARIKNLPRLIDAVKSVGTSNDIETKKDTKGFISEEAVGLLLSRYGVFSVGHGYVPIESNLSEDQSFITSTGGKNSWDLSIFTDYPVSPTRTHRLQIKTRRSHYDRNYTVAEDFSIIHVSSLGIESDPKRIGKPEQILFELHEEYFNDCDASSDNLDERTELLLDMFS